MPASDFRKSSHHGAMHGAKGGFQKLDESGAPVEAENNVSEWTSEDVGKWLDKLGLGEHAKSFAHHRIVGDMVHSLTESHLIELGVTIIGQRMTFLRDASRIRRHSANKVRFETIWESDAEMYTRGPADWLYRQCIFEPCCEQPDHYKLTASSLSLTIKQKQIGCCQDKERVTRNIDLSNVAGVSEYEGKVCCDMGCAADWIYIELDGNKMLDTVAPLAVKRGEGDKVALEIQMAMEEAQLFHQANETMQR